MQDPNTLRQRYEQISNLLRNARKMVPVNHIVAAEADTEIAQPGRTQSGQDEFEKFMGVGEYEYAWLALVSTAALHPPKPEFWSQIANAAVLLIGKARTPDFQQQVRGAILRHGDLRTAINAIPSRPGNEGEQAAIAALLRTLEGA